MQYQQINKDILITMKIICCNEGIPRFSWTEDEVNKMNAIKDLQLAVIRKFSYGWLELEDLQIQIPKQYHIKGESKIGLLRQAYIDEIFKNGGFCKHDVKECLLHHWEGWSCTSNAPIDI